MILKSIDIVVRQFDEQGKAMFAEVTIQKFQERSPRSIQIGGDAETVEWALATLKQHFYDQVPKEPGSETPVFATAQLKEALATDGKSMEGKPCADHGKPILPGWLDFDVTTTCLCGEPIKE